MPRISGTIFALPKGFHPFPKNINPKQSLATPVINDTDLAESTMRKRMREATIEKSLSNEEIVVDEGDDDNENDKRNRRINEGFADLEGWQNCLIVDVSDNWMRKEEVDHLMGIIIGLPKVESIRLSNTTSTFEEANYLLEQISIILQHYKPIKHLSLSGWMISFEDIEPILKNITTLNGLDLSYCDIIDPENFWKGMARYAEQFVELNLLMCDIDDGGKEFMGFIKNCWLLEVLIVKDIAQIDTLSTPTLLQIFASIADLQYLRTFSICSVAFDSKVDKNNVRIQALAMAVKDKYLMELEFRSTSTDYKVVETIVDGLLSGRACHTVHTLTFGNGISAETLEKIGNAFSHGKFLALRSFALGDVVQAKNVDALAKLMHAKFKTFTGMEEDGLPMNNGDSTDYFKNYRLPTRRDIFVLSTSQISNNNYLARAMSHSRTQMSIAAFSGRATLPELIDRFWAFVFMNRGAIIYLQDRHPEDLPEGVGSEAKETAIWKARIIFPTILLDFLQEEHQGIMNSQECRALIASTLDQDQFLARIGIAYQLEKLVRSQPRHHERVTPKMYGDMIRSIVYLWKEQLLTTNVVHKLLSPNPPELHQWLACLINPDTVPELRQRVDWWKQEEDKKAAAKKGVSPNKKSRVLSEGREGSPTKAEVKTKKKRDKKAAGKEDASVVNPFGGGSGSGSGSRSAGPRKAWVSPQREKI